ncbi:hypothetical protein ACWPKO_23600 (plasmid) [Coraliomargarita sp. W4R53]
MTSPLVPVPPVSASPAPTPAQSELFARSSKRLSVQDYVPRTAHDGIPAASKCEWSEHVAPSLSRQELGALAWVLADTVMRARCGKAVKPYTIWRHHTLASTAIPQPSMRVVQSFVEPVFGLPGNNSPAVLDNVQGHVAEWLWHLLTQDSAAVQMQPEPKGSVTDGGGDGFSIYEAPNGALKFRLWESKKYTGGGSAAGSIRTACRQLSSEGQRYVAQLVGALSGDPRTSGRIATLVAALPEAWAVGDDIVGAGVAITTHSSLRPRPFRKMADKLPLLNKPGQLRGFAMSISDYVDLATTVRGYLWTAL